MLPVEKRPKFYLQTLSALLDILLISVLPVEKRPKFYLQTLSALLDILLISVLPVEKRTKFYLQTLSALLDILLISVLPVEKRPKFYLQTLSALLDILLISVLPVEKRPKFYLQTLSALPRICQAFPPLCEDVIKLLSQLGQVCSAHSAVNSTMAHGEILKNNSVLDKLKSIFANFSNIELKLGQNLTLESQKGNKHTLQPHLRILL